MVLDLISYTFYLVKYKELPMTKFLDSQEMQELGKEITKNTTLAINDTLHNNETMHILNTGILCALCYNMLRRNFIPLATAAVCIGCGISLSSPIYKSIKEAFKEPFKGFDK